MRTALPSRPMPRKRRRWQPQPLASRATPWTTCDCLFAVAAGAPLTRTPTQIQIPRQTRAQSGTATKLMVVDETPMAAVEAAFVAAAAAVDAGSHAGR